MLLPPKQAVTQTFTKRSSDSKEKYCTDNSKLNSEATKTKQMVLKERFIKIDRKLKETIKKWIPLK
jgi:hypothetical protein